MIINKFKCNWVAASIKQKSVLKIFSSFHAIKKKKQLRRASWVRVGVWMGLGDEGTEDLRA